MTLSPKLQQLLAQLPESEQLDFQALLGAIYTTRFTGPVTFDFLNGLPRQINLGQPVKLAICTGLPADQQGGLDSSPAPRSG